MRINTITKCCLWAGLFIGISSKVCGQPPWDYQTTSKVHELEISASIVPQISGNDIEDRDVIGVFFDSSGTDYCGGFMYWKDTQAAQVIKAYGQEPGKPGFENGDSIKIKIWDRDRDCIVENLNVTFASNQYYPDSYAFKVNGKSKITSMEGKNGVVQYPRRGFCQDAKDPLPQLKDVSSPLKFKSPQGIKVNASNGKIDLDNSKPGIYEIEFETLKYNTDVCLANPLDSIHIKEIPKISLGKDRSFCEGDTVFLSPGGKADLYKWSVNNQNRKVFPATKGGQYYVEARSQDGCIKRDTVQLTKISKPGIDLKDTFKACESAELNVDVQSNDTEVTWSNGEKGEAIKVSESKGLAVEKKNAHGCKAYDSTHVQLSPNLNLTKLEPEVNHSECQPSGEIFVKNAREDIQGGVPPFTYKLMPLNKGFAKTDSQLNFQSLKPGSYRLEVKDAFGCKETFEVKMKNCDYPVITPNSGGKADKYYIDGQGTAKVYDRSGKLKRTLDLPTHWEGRDKRGSTVPMGIYRIVINEDKQILISVVR